MKTTCSSRQSHRLGLSVVAAAAITLAAPVAAADDPPVGYEVTLTVSSDNGQWSVGSTYALTVTANPPTPGTVKFCVSGNGFVTCYNPIPTQDGIATVPWKPTRQGTYTVESRYTTTASGGTLTIGSIQESIRVYCPGHQGSSWNC